MKDEWRSGLDPEVTESCEMAIDLDAEETTCPACMATFKPNIPMCPECGLRFG